jgi:hypothetical protein
LEDNKMAINVSPGVFTRIVDLSEYVRQVPSTIGFIPIFTEKGPDNELIFTNGSDYFKDFGEPNAIWGGGGEGTKWTYGQYCAANFLSQSDSLYVVRLMPEDSNFATLALKATNPDYTGNTDGTSVVEIDTTFSDGTNNSVLDFQTKYAVDADTTSEEMDLAVFYGAGRGSYYNQIKIELLKPEDPYLAQDQKMYYLNVYRRLPNLTVDSEPGVNATYDYGIVESFMVSFDYTQLDSNGDSAWIEDVLNNNSKFVRCIANSYNCSLAITAGSDFSVPFVEEVSTSSIDTSGNIVYTVSSSVLPQALDGGDDGGLFENGKLSSTICKSLIGKLFSGTLLKNTGAQSSDSGEALVEILDSDNYYFSVVFCPYSDAFVNYSLAKLCQTRGDCVGIIDNGDNRTISSSLTRRTAGDGSLTGNLNYKEVAIYDSYEKIFDQYTAKSMWISPVYAMSSVIPYSDKVSDIWYAPAGPNRASLSDVEELRYNPGTVGQRDQLYLKQINPLVQFSDLGTIVYGQLTSQRRPTALQDLNVVRTVLYIKKALAQYCRFYIFEMNDSDTWARISGNVSSFLTTVKSKRGLRSFSVDVGATEYELKAKQCHVNVTLVPMKVIEQIHLTFFVK